MRAERVAEIMRRGGLADGADIVLLALDSQQRSTPDRSGVDRAAAIGELALGQQRLLEDPVFLNGDYSIKYLEQWLADTTPSA